MKKDWIIAKTYSHKDGTLFKTIPQASADEVRQLIAEEVSKEIYKNKMFYNDGTAFAEDIEEIENTLYGYASFIDDHDHLEVYYINISAIPLDDIEEAYDGEGIWE